MSQDMKVIVFQIKDKEYAVPVDKVSGIEKLLHITRVPKAALFVKGVINLRGVITPIIDLRVRLVSKRWDTMVQHGLSLSFWRIWKWD